MNREIYIRQAVISENGKFPKQLAESGIMFYKGERITLEDFAKEKQKLQSAGVSFNKRSG